MDANALSKLKQAALAAQQRADQAKGVAQEAMRNLEADFGVKTLDEAIALLAKLEKEATEAEAAADRQYKTLQAEWGDILDELGI